MCGCKDIFSKSDGASDKTGEEAEREGEERKVSRIRREAIKLLTKADSEVVGSDRHNTERAIDTFMNNVTIEVAQAGTRHLPLVLPH